MTATMFIALVTLAVQSDPQQTCLLGKVDRARTLSSTCLSCHDGSAAPSVAFHTATSGGSHPVSVTYAFARPEVAVRPIGPLDPLVVLPGGRVECVSCHAGDGTGPHKTVLSFSALCTGCHQK